MAKARDPNLPQHHIDTMHYGSLPVEMLPDGTQTWGVWMWDGFQWQNVRIVGGGGVDISYDAANNYLEIAIAGIRKYNTFSGDAVLLDTFEDMFDADSILLKSISSTFTADSVLS